MFAVSVRLLAKQSVCSCADTSDVSNCVVLSSFERQFEVYLRWNSNSFSSQFALTRSMVQPSQNANAVDNERVKQNESSGTASRLPRWYRVWHELGSAPTGILASKSLQDKFDQFADVQLGQREINSLKQRRADSDTLAKLLAEREWIIWVFCLCSWTDSEEHGPIQKFDGKKLQTSFWKPSDDSWPSGIVS